MTSKAGKNRDIVRKSLVEATKSGLMAGITQFMKDGKGRGLPTRTWVNSNGSEVYVRSWRNPTLGGELQVDLATINISLRARRKGVFSYVLEQVEEVCRELGYVAIKVENVNPKLRELIAHLEARGFKADGKVDAKLFSYLKRIG